MITSIEIENLRSIKHLKAPLGALTVLVGENGTGKSSIIRGLQLASAWARRLSTPDEPGVVAFQHKESQEWSGYTGNLSLPFYEWARIDYEAPWQEESCPWVAVRARDRQSEGDLRVDVYFELVPGMSTSGTTFSAHATSGQVGSLVRSIADTKIAPTDRVSWSPPLTEEYRLPAGYGPSREPVPEPPGMDLNRVGLPQHLEYYWEDFKASLRNIAAVRSKRDAFSKLGLDLLGVDWGPALLDADAAPMSRRRINPKVDDPDDQDIWNYFKRFEPVVPAPERMRAIDAAAGTVIKDLPPSAFRSEQQRLQLLGLAVNSYLTAIEEKKGRAWPPGVNDENRALLTKAYRAMVGDGFTKFGDRRERDVFTPFDLESLGTRQLLPVLAHLVAAETGSTLITEEPEISLHPRVQVRIGERFVDEAARGLQLIFSTHSHYLLLGICKRIREGAIDPKDVIVIECRKSRRGTTSVRRKVDGQGHIEGWIPSFLEVDDYLFNEWFATAGDNVN